MKLDGGCACGAVRFHVADDEPRDCGYCHCRICQRTSGAPVMVFSSVKRTSVQITGDYTVYPSTDVGERWFCPRCGGQFAMFDKRAPEDLELAISCLDDPGVVAPHFHIWISSKLPWFEVDDDLRRYARSRADEDGDR